MLWQKQLQELEQAKQWNEAILFMQHVIVETPKLDAYLAMSYLLMNLLVEEDYDDDKHDYYEALSKKYFNAGYQKFSHNPEYLFFIGTIASISPWYMNIADYQVCDMLKTAALLEPTNQLYVWGSYGMESSSNLPIMSLRDAYAERVTISPHLMHMIKSKGTLGEYILMMVEFSCARGKLNMVGK